MKPYSKVSFKRLHHPFSTGFLFQDNQSYVAHMNDGDFYGSEQSFLMPGGDTAQIVLKDNSGTETILKD